MTKQITKAINLPLFSSAYMIKCGKCEWKFAIFAIIENERECPDVEPITYSYLEQENTIYCPMCGVEIDRT